MTTSVSNEEISLAVSEPATPAVAPKKERGGYRIKQQPPTIVRPPETMSADFDQVIRQGLTDYARSMNPDRRVVLDHYPVMVEEFADAMAEGRPVRLTGQGPDLEPIPGEPFPVRDVHDSLLNCFTASPTAAIPPGEGPPELEAGRRDLEGEESEGLFQPPG